MDELARALRQVVGPRDAALAHLPLSWNGASWPLKLSVQFTWPG